jgi:hypothetical protein
MKKYYSNSINSKYGAEERKRAMPYSFGRAVPRAGSQQACLCVDKLTYSRKCCKGYLLNQGIGQITAPYIIPGPPPVTARAFSNGFSNAFS